MRGFAGTTMLTASGNGSGRSGKTLAIKVEVKVEGSSSRPLLGILLFVVIVLLRVDSRRNLVVSWLRLRLALHFQAQPRLATDKVFVHKP